MDDGQFDRPYAIDCENTDCVYVDDCGNRRIWKFTPDRTFVAASTVF